MKPNRLINEKSPYLRQHAYNPVDWYPWGDEAFERARREDKPIFLSIGYSSCHWCHVMEKESFDDEEVAEILNKYFISIKVDREERPDIDNIYMKACHIFTGRGGWPLSVFMNHRGETFFADTYIPKEDAYGKIGFKRLLMRIVELWKTEREKIEGASQEVRRVLERIYAKYAVEKLDEKIIDRAYEEIKGHYDKDYGGFGNAPKFPLPLNIIFLFHYYDNTKKEDALKMALYTLRKMRMGGIYDQIGYGYHRYSTDRYWLVPHFEKMLYDNALLLNAYVEAYIRTKDQFYKDVALEIWEYLKREMFSEEGGFYSAQDADSEEGEGEFYLWSYDELKSLLSKDEMEFCEVVFSIRKEGNFRDEVTATQKGKNILYMSDESHILLEKLNLVEDDFKSKLRVLREKLHNVRKKRKSPMRDEKILTDWNSLAIVALARGGKILQSQELLDSAKKTSDFIIARMIKDGKLMHRYFHGDIDIEALLEDYAYFIWALIELYFTTFESRYLKIAKEFTDKVIKNFWDAERGGFFQSSTNTKDLIVKPKEIYDGVMPSGNSVMAYLLVILGRIFGNRDYEKKAFEILEYFSSQIYSQPSAHLFSVITLDLLLNGTVEIFGVGNDREELINIMRDIGDRYGYLKKLILGIKDNEIETLALHITSMKARNNKATFYICENFQCLPPKDMEDLNNFLYRRFFL